MKRTVIVIALMALAAPAVATPTAPADGWLGWLGCWELIAERQGDAEREGDDASAPEQGRRTVCIEPSTSAGVTLTSAVDGIDVLQRTVVADGRDQLVDDAGCEGSERAWWSADGHRLYVTSTLACEAGNVRNTSGISMLTASNRWVDIQLANVAGQREVLVRRYSRMAADTARRAGAERDLTLAATTARQAAAAPLDLEDILEAVAAVDVAAVETMLLEGSIDFVADSKALLRLDDAGVPGQLIDLVVALSYPDYFAVDADGATAAQEQPLVVAYPVYAYGYWSAGFSPFGWGYSYYPSYPYYGYYPPGIGGGGGGGNYGGRVVNGQGYTRVRAVPTPHGDFGSFLRGGSRGNPGGGSGGGASGGASSGGSMSGSGASSGGGSGTRTAKPRGGSH